MFTSLVLSPGPSLFTRSSRDSDLALVDTHASLPTVTVAAAGGQQAPDAAVELLEAFGVVSQADAVGELAVASCELASAWFPLIAPAVGPDKIDNHVGSLLD